MPIHRDLSTRELGVGVRNETKRKKAIDGTSQGYSTLPAVVLVGGHGLDQHGPN